MTIRCVYVTYEVLKQEKITSYVIHIKNIKLLGDILYLDNNYNFYLIGRNIFYIVQACDYSRKLRSIHPASFTSGHLEIVFI